MSNSPLKFGPLAAMGIGAGLNLLGGVLGSSAARREQRKAEAAQRRARAEMNRMKDIYSSIDTSNPYMNMENVFEDLTINQQQAQFERDQFQQSQANILDSLRSAAGGSGIAATAQALAQQGQIAAQRSAASIGQQEAKNQALAAQQAGKLQSLERQGDLISRAQQREQTGTLLGMAQADVVGAQSRVAAAKKAGADAWSGAIGGIGNILTAGISGGAFGGGVKATANVDFDENLDGDYNPLTS